MESKVRTGVCGKSGVINMSHRIPALLRDCTLCPRQCHTDRLSGQTGYCGQTAVIKAARASLHFWEEPCISGTNGSGTLFFSGCNLRCVFCQNYNIANGCTGREISVGRLTEIFFELRAQGAHNINLVTPTHYVPQIAAALTDARKQGLDIPVVYNSGGYEEVSSLRLLEGLIDIYLPDMKYYSADLSTRFSHAPDYFIKASAALTEMFRQVGPPVFTSPAQDNMTPGEACAQTTQPMLLRKGMIVRHLVLPGQTKDSKKILRFLHKTFGNDIYISIMNQYTPLQQVSDIPELNRRVSAEEYARVLRFAERLGIYNGFIQEGEAAAESFIPEFDCRGI